MLICDKAFYKDDHKPKKIYCKVTGGLCAHVRYCSLSMKYFHTDHAKDCVMREKEEAGK